MPLQKTLYSKIIALLTKCRTILAMGRFLILATFVALIDSVVVEVITSGGYCLLFVHVDSGSHLLHEITVIVL